MISELEKPQKEYRECSHVLFLLPWYPHDCRVTNTVRRINLMSSVFPLGSSSGSIDPHCSWLLPVRTGPSGSPFYPGLFWSIQSVHSWSTLVGLTWHCLVVKLKLCVESAAGVLCILGVSLWEPVLCSRACYVNLGLCIQVASLRFSTAKSSSFFFLTLRLGEYPVSHHFSFF